MYGGKYNYGGRGSGPKRMPQGQTQQEIHIHQEAHNPPVLGTIGFVIAVIVLIIIILMIFKAFKNVNDAVSVIVSPPTKNPCYYWVNSATATDYPAPNTTLGWNSNYGSLTFTPGFWLVTINSYIFTEGTNYTSSYLNNYHMGLSTGDGISDPIDYINDSGSSPASSQTTGTGVYVNSATGASITPPLALPYLGGPLYMPTLTIYVNVPQTITYYLMGIALFTATSTSVTSNISPFVNYVQATAVRLGGFNTTIPYSSTFSTGSSKSGGSGSKSSGSSGSSGSSSKSSGSSGTSGSTFSGKSTFVRNMQRPMMQRPMMYHSMM